MIHNPTYHTIKLVSRAQPLADDQQALYASWKSLRREERALFDGYGDYRCAVEMAASSERRVPA